MRIKSVFLIAQRYENILGNFSMTDQIMAKNISDLITEIADDTEYIYKSSVSDYDYFYELFEDTGMSETGRNAMITKNSSDNPVYE